MRGQVFWDNDEKTILRQIYPDTPTADDIKDIAIQSYEMITAVPHKVHLIIETKNTKAVRNSLIEVSRDLDKYVAPNQGFVDGWDALRQRDWKAIGLSAGVAAITLAMYPKFFTQIQAYHEWSASVIFHYGVIGAALVTAIIIAVRKGRLDDLKTLGLLLAPVWAPYTLQYSYTAVLFTMRKAGWLRNVIFLAAGLLLAKFFWQDFHTSEQIGALGMLLLAAILAPAYRDEPAAVTAEQAAPEVVQISAANR